jgi:hypothetical protein
MGNYPRCPQCGWRGVHEAGCSQKTGARVARTEVEDGWLPSYAIWGFVIGIVLVLAYWWYMGPL